MLASTTFSLYCTALPPPLFSLGHHPNVSTVCLQSASICQSESFGSASSASVSKFQPWLILTEIKAEDVGGLHGVGAPFGRQFQLEL